MALGLATGRVIVEIFFESHPFNIALLSIAMAFCTGFLIGLPCGICVFRGIKKKLKKQIN